MENKNQNNEFYQLSVYILDVILWYLTHTDWLVFFVNFEFRCEIIAAIHCFFFRFTCVWWTDILYKKNFQTDGETHLIHIKSKRSRDKCRFITTFHVFLFRNWLLSSKQIDNGLHRAARYYTLQITQYTYAIKTTLIPIITTRALHVRLYSYGTRYACNGKLNVLLISIRVNTSTRRSHK